MSVETICACAERHPRWSLVIILLIAALLRATNLGYTNLWLDELYSFQVANGHFPPRTPLPGVQTAQFFYEHYIAWQPMDFERLIRLLIINVHLPLYYLLLNPWLGLFGVSAEALRAFSGVFSVLLILPLYALGKSLGGVRAGLLVALAAALNPAQIYYAQEGRMYTLTLFWAVLSSLALWKALYAPRTLPWALAYAVALVGGFFSHYVFAFFLAFHAVFAGIEFFCRPRRRYFLLAIPAMALGLAVWLWFPVYQQQHSGVEEFYHFAKTTVSPLRYLTVFVWNPLVMASGENTWMKACYIPLTVAILLGCVVSRVRTGKVSAGEIPGQAAESAFQWRRDGFLLCWIFAPLAVQVGYDLLKETHTSVITRYVVLISPAMALLLGLGLERIAAWKTWGTRAFAGLLGLMAFLALATVWAPSPFRDTHNKKNVRVPIAYFFAHRQPGDLVMVNGPNGVASLVAFYLCRTDPGQPMIFWVKQERGEVHPFPAREVFAPYPRVWFYSQRSNDERGLDEAKHTLGRWYGHADKPGDWHLFRPKKP